MYKERAVMKHFHKTCKQYSLEFFKTLIYAITAITATILNHMTQNNKITIIQSGKFLILIGDNIIQNFSVPFIDHDKSVSLNTQKKKKLEDNKWKYSMYNNTIS